MLGPVSCINHSCEPNVKFECGGATKLIVRVYPLRDIHAGEELLVKLFWAEQSGLLLCSLYFKKI